MTKLHSSLWKASQLAWVSTFFPTMVRTACNIAGKEYSDTALMKVATNPTILGTFDLLLGESIDSAIVRAMQDQEKANKLDNDIKFICATL